MIMLHMIVNQLTSFTKVLGLKDRLGSKGHFHQKCCNSSMLHSMTIRFIMLISLRPTCAMGSNVKMGLLGVTGVKRSFYQKCANLSMLRSMTIRLIHVDQRKILYLCYDVKCQSGVIWGHCSQKGHFHQKCYNSSTLHSRSIRLIHQGCQLSPINHESHVWTLFLTRADTKHVIKSLASIQNIPQSI